MSYEIPPLRDSGLELRRLGHLAKRSLGTWEPFLLSPIRIWIHLLYNISNISLKKICLGVRCQFDISIHSSFPASWPCRPMSSKSTSCSKLKPAKTIGNQPYSNIDDSDDSRVYTPRGLLVT